ncbi:hypothetical protein AMTR_s00020p00194490 [Amborella trichopoda]|uniref:Uncharacterized protein n=1 Tax=Amborella trichopoda TaxID=13333 RepID=W1PVN7_AMBTC|nr:hypothetical protein AMTR_s00020p00194490 [Amborella trichopoda]
MRMVWEACLQLPGLSKFVVLIMVMAGKCFTPSFFHVFDLNYYPANWRGLDKPRSLDKDEADMQYLSLRGKTKSLFDDFSSSFGGIKGGWVSDGDEKPILGLDALRGSGSCSGPVDRPKRGPRVPTAVEPMSVPLRERDDRKEGKKRKGTKKSKSSSPALARGNSVSKRGSFAVGASSTSPHVKCARVEVHITSTRPPVTPIPAPVIEPRTIAA